MAEREKAGKERTGNKKAEIVKTENPKAENQESEIEALLGEAAVLAAEAEHQAAVNALKCIMQDDETYFRETTAGFTDEEMEEYLAECPEDRIYWKKG
ncbi:MAG: hypothetical protein Q4F29_11150 [Lachnospiraceae bacterium]|nr:hypothetical protein [Lachnospiraceae bacterium]